MESFGFHFLFFSLRCRWFSLSCPSTSRSGSRPLSLLYCRTRHCSIFIECGSCLRIFISLTRSSYNQRASSLHPIWLPFLLSVNFFLVLDFPPRVSDIQQWCSFSKKSKANASSLALNMALTGVDFLFLLNPWSFGLTADRIRSTKYLKLASSSGFCLYDCRSLYGGCSSRSYPSRSLDSSRNFNGENPGGTFDFCLSSDSRRGKQRVRKVFFWSTLHHERRIANVENLPRKFFRANVCALCRHNVTFFLRVLVQ